MSATNLDPVFCGLRTLSQIENDSATAASYVTVTDTTNTYFEFTVTTLPLATAPGSIFFTVSVSLTDSATVTYSLPVELQITCPFSHSILKSSTPSFGSPFSYPLLNLPSQVETVSVVAVTPQHSTCGYTIVSAEIIDVTDGANPLVETMITYSDASA